MTVIRVEKTKNYTVMSNEHFKNKEMSLRAKGLLSLMLSLPDEWDYSVEGLTKLSKDGRDATNSALQELETLGYLKRNKMLLDNRFNGYEYVVYESPFTEFPYTENPSTGIPNTGTPFTGNPTQLNTNNQLNTDQSNDYHKNNGGTADFSNHPTQEQIDEIISRWNAIPFTNDIMTITPMTSRWTELQVCFSIFGYGKILDAIGKVASSPYLKNRGGVAWDRYMNRNAIQGVLEGNYGRDFAAPETTDDRLRKMGFDI